MLNPGQTDRFFNERQVVIDLRAAADIMAEREWIKGFDFNGTGGCCAYGAIRIAVGDHESSSYASPEVRDRANNCARAFYRSLGVEITKFNDQVATSCEEVIFALKKVADDLERSLPDA